MKRIIFRNPFVTKRDREIAMNMLNMAEELQEMAAHRLGFRNKEDAKEWANRHKK